MNISATHSCELTDNTKCKLDTYETRVCKNILKLNNCNTNYDGFFVSKFIHVTNSQVRYDLCRNWSKYSLVELSSYLTKLVST